MLKIRISSVSTSLVISVMVLCLFYNYVGAVGGRCSSDIPKHRKCESTEDQCNTDAKCTDDQICCNDGCKKTCTPPLHTACELQKVAAERHLHALGPDTNISIFIPKCNEKDGSFEEIQCSNSSDLCWCVNSEVGLEIPDTRGKKGEKINCKTGQGKCLGPTCRMFCDYGFSLDNMGCPICKCYNPCQDVTCPAATACEVKKVDCVNEKCPVTTCRQPRTLDSLCPSGNPLLGEGGEKPLLCGIESYKPQCPNDKYKCNVQEGRDYGVCCPYSGKIGKCPVDYEITECPASKCTSDVDCTGEMKCCQNSKCGSVCMGAVNNTLCLQQTEIAKHRGDVIFIPSCTSTGEFEPKQCSSNGKLCWCVDKKGSVIEGTMQTGGSALVCNNSQDCSSMALCRLKCQYGFKKDNSGCEICECVNPCETKSCPKENVCIVEDGNPVCKSEVPISDRSPGRRTNPCKIGLPLVDKKYGGEIFCGRGGNRQDCPRTYKCEIHPTDAYAVCCATANSIEKTKIGECLEFIPEPRLCPIEKNGSCVSDSHCPDKLHCCPSVICGSLCTEPDVDSLPDPNQLPTICEYLRNLKRVTGSSPSGRSLATHNPKCKKNGLWDPVQCHNDECWCVDEFGTEIDNTRGKASEKYDCRKARNQKGCEGLLCRLGCRYGFVKGDDGCPICECRSPCSGINCGDGRVCVQRDVNCGTGYCPVVATCELKKDNLVQTCPRGSKPLIYEDKAVITCDNKYFKCPDSYVCQGNTEMAAGICCTNTTNEIKAGQCPATGRSAVDICAEQCQTDVDCPGPQKCCPNGCGAHACTDPAGVKTKPGQCPYILSKLQMSCDFQCSSDFDCSNSQKCCSNGCGTACTVPKTNTACQHEREIAQHRRKQSRQLRLSTQMPVCNKDDGSYDSIQCDAAGRTCWCVDEKGGEKPGTRVGLGQLVNCDSPAACPRHSCRLNCIHGYDMNSNGCPICKCKDPCQNKNCESKEECRIVKVNCVTDPCPPIAMCLPKLSNPCESGSPLKKDASNEFLECGPKKNQCPSSHACKMDPFGQFSVCCPKPKSSCDQEVDIGDCRAALPRWYFDSQSNGCKRFTYGGCGGNLNNFQSEDHCKETCPVKTTCQVVKKKSKRLRNFFSSKAAFKPRCESKSGSWKNIQCMDSFGLCWCVNKKGKQVPGTLVRGIPKCSSRGGRAFDETAICKGEESVNICRDDHCKGMTCKAHPDAACRVNPCGTCKAQFYDEGGESVDCNEGLKKCEVKQQLIVNSHRYRNQGADVEKNNFYDDDKSSVSNDEPAAPSQSLPPASRRRRQSGDKSDSRVVPIMMSLAPPQCQPDGQFSPVQTQNGLSWCVDKSGSPIHTTLSKGSIKCNSDGSLINKVDPTPVCQDTFLPLRVCDETCLHVRCPSHPDVICSADPCNNCMTTFTDINGEKVDCTPKCQQQLKKGTCNKQMKRFFYNQQTSKCEEFMYGGCDGNDNNFESYDECQDRCEVKASVCDKPAEVGICRLHEERWFYNKHTQQCEEFVYGGCGGNDNNFLTKVACEARCPNLVVCPSTAVRGDDIEPCSRDKVCAGLTCSDKEATCTVDPCTCKSMYVDPRGQKVKCDSVEPDLPSYTFDGTKCEKIREEQFKSKSAFMVACDKDGKYLPMQCGNKSDDRQEKCWCIDEAGFKLPNATMLNRTEQQCEMVKIESVDIVLAFRHDGQLNDKQTNQIKKSFDKILNTMSAEVKNEIDVENDAGNTSVKFVLIGDNKVDVTYHLEKMMNEVKFKLPLNDKILESDYTSSKFYHRHASPSSIRTDSSDDDEESSSVPVIVAVVIIVILVVVAVIIAVVLYRKRVRRYSPKKLSGNMNKQGENI